MRANSDISFLEIGVFPTGRSRGFDGPVRTETNLPDGKALAVRADTKTAASGRSIVMPVTKVDCRQD